MVRSSGPRTASTMQNSDAPRALVSAAAPMISSGSRKGVALTTDSNLADEEVQELLVVATELCTNALRYTGAGLVTLRAWEEDLHVVVEVEGVDAGAARNLDDADERGRGMRIVQSLCDEVSVVVRGRNRFVRCRKRLTASL